MILDEWKEVVAGSVIALSGGIIGYLASPAEDHSFKTALLKGISSGFIGMLIGFICLYWNVPETLSYFLCGTSGYMGSEVTLVIFKKYIERKFTNLP